MNEILFINACIRENSRTLELANHVLSKLKGNVSEIELNKMNLKPIDLDILKLREISNQKKDFSDSAFDLAKQFANADTIVIAAPYWDLMFPAVMKTYLETITVNGLTFCYGKDGRPKGLCKAKRLIYVTTSGGPIINNFGYEYVNAVSKSFFGIEKVDFVSAQCLDIYGADVLKSLKEAKESFTE